MAFIGSHLSLNLFYLTADICLKKTKKIKSVTFEHFKISGHNTVFIRGINQKNADFRRIVGNAIQF